MTSLIVRDLHTNDRAAWQTLWDAYNAFYGRTGETALPVHITETTRRRFFDASEPVYAIVAVIDGEVVGLAHFLTHRSTTRIELTCYLQDLYTAESHRGRGVGRALIEGVYQRAREMGIQRVYWQTRDSNAAGRSLYDKVAAHHGFIVYSIDLPPMI
jgi:GNAT superfamily N-acetyltransferase